MSSIGWGGDRTVVARTVLYCLEERTSRIRHAGPHAHRHQAIQVRDFPMMSLCPKTGPRSAPRRSEPEAEAQNWHTLCCSPKDASDQLSGAPYLSYCMVDFADQHKLSCAPQTHIYCSSVFFLSLLRSSINQILRLQPPCFINGEKIQSSFNRPQEKIRALYLASQFGPARGMPEKKTIQNLHTHTRTTLFKIFILTPVFTVPVCFASAVGVSVRQVDQVKGLKGGCRCRVEAGAGGPDTGAASARVSTPTVRAHEWHPPNARAPRA